MKVLAPHLLPPGTILHNKYTIAEVIGEGGFGITYEGYDNNLSLKVAIKEYYPHNYASRTSSASATIFPLTGEKGEFFDAIT